MGWLFGWDSRKSLVRHLVEGNGIKTLKSCSVGNNLWTVQEYTTNEGEQVRFACLYLIKGPPYGREDGHGWGYKDVDESMGPYEISFPYTWLDLLTPTDSQYANEWRARVKARGEKLQKATVGSKWFFRNGGYTVVKRCSPTCWIVKDDNGYQYRMSSKMFAAANLLPEGLQ